MDRLSKLGERESSLASELDNDRLDRSRSLSRLHLLLHLSDVLRLGSAKDEVELSKLTLDDGRRGRGLKVVVGGHESGDGLLVLLDVLLRSRLDLLRSLASGLASISLSASFPASKTKRETHLVSRSSDLRLLRQPLRLDLGRLLLLLLRLGIDNGSTALLQGARSLVVGLELLDTGVERERLVDERADASDVLLLSLGALRFVLLLLVTLLVATTSARQLRP